MTRPKKHGMWTASFVGISLTQLAVFVVFYALLTALPLYVTRELGGSATEAGLVVTLMIITQLLSRFGAEPMLQRLGRKRGLVLAVLAFALVTSGYLWADALGLLYVIRLLHGIPFGIITTATGAIAANVVPVERRGEGIGYFAMATNVAVVIGPFVGLILLQHISFTMVFAILSVVAFASVAVSLVVHVPGDQPREPAVLRGEEPVSRPGPRRGWSINEVIETKAIPISAVTGVITLAYAGITAFVPVFADGIDLSAAAAYFFVVYAAAMLITRPYFGKRYDTRGPTSVIVPGLVFFAAGFAALSLTSSALILLGAAALVGLGFGTLQPSLQTMAVQTTSYERAGHATATFFTFFDTGIGIGSIVLGLVVDAFGFRTLYAGSAVLMAVTIPLYLAVASSHQTPEAPTAG